MTSYETAALEELQRWQRKMLENPSLFDSLSKKVQNRLNNFIPEKVHKVITVTIQKMIEAVLFGAKYTTTAVLKEGSLLYREAHIREKVDFYKKTAATEGALTGAGGILLGLADFPLLIGIKIKLLFDIAALYGYDVKDYKERLYILYVFQLAFSSAKRRKEVYQLLADWPLYKETLPENVEDFDWRTFQQEYRDYIDLAKMAQLIPVIGAAVGAVANYRLINKLAETARNAYRIRYFDKQ
ncbi:EcsC family protein [Rubrolithibacter danxiaensis]|uniref:EcsC family protein n=1 Tax=Rubrolithibacter danxiaensis TaxID=3390805 RepID=UPI003BF8CB2E